MALSAAAAAVKVGSSSFLFDETGRRFNKLPLFVDDMLAMEDIIDVFIDPRAGF